MSRYQVYCKYLCINGEAPTEDIVEQMIKATTCHADSKGWNKVISETQYWFPLMNTDDMIFYIVRTYEDKEQ